MAPGPAEEEAQAAALKAIAASKPMPHETLRFANSFGALIDRSEPYINLANGWVLNACISR